MEGSSRLKGALMFETGRPSAQSMRFIRSRATPSPQAPIPRSGFVLRPELLVPLSVHASLSMSWCRISVAHSPDAPTLATAMKIIDPATEGDADWMTFHHDP